MFSSASRDAYVGEHKTSSGITFTLTKCVTLVENELQTWQQQLNCALSHNGMPGLTLS